MHWEACIWAHRASYRNGFNVSRLAYRFFWVPLGKAIQHVMESHYWFTDSYQTKKLCRPCMSINRVSHASPALWTINRLFRTYVVILAWNPLPKHLIERARGHIGRCSYLKEVSCSIQLWCEFELQKAVKGFLTNYQISGISLGAQTDGFSATFAGMWR